MLRTGCLIGAALFPFCLYAQTATESRRIYHERYAARLQPMLCQAIAFRTVEGSREAITQQSRWLASEARQLGFIFRDAGAVSEIELPGPPGAPVLGLVVHGDVQPAGDSEWSVPPFTCTMKEGYLYGRGVADDKGPLVQNLLAMAALRDTGRPRTHTIRLLVGSDEESTNKDITTYLQTHKAPDFTLVTDSYFPVVIGEKAWDRLDVTVADPYRPRGTAGRGPLWDIVRLEAGIAPSIVPARADAVLHPTGASQTPPVSASLCQPPSSGYLCSWRFEGQNPVFTVIGRAAHSGMNIEGGRNALVYLANLLRDKTTFSGAHDLLEFAAFAGKDLYGTSLGLTARDAVWGRYNVNVATIAPVAGGALQLSINLRRTPPRSAPQMKSYLQRVVSDFNASHHTALQFGAGFFQDEPISFDPNSKLVKRLLASYTRATGEPAKPVVAGGATYAKRLPNAIAFGMWFPGKPYPGHDVDERILISDLDRGVDVLLETLADLAFSPPLKEPFRP